MSDFDASFHYRGGEAELAVELEGACVDNHGAGVEAGGGGFVDDADRNAKQCEIESEEEAGGASTDDENWMRRHWVISVGFYILYSALIGW